jgi:hypothetical protein
MCSVVQFSAAAAPEQSAWDEVVALVRDGEVKSLSLETVASQWCIARAGEEGEDEKAPSAASSASAANLTNPAACDDTPLLKWMEGDGQQIYFQVMRDVLSALRDPTDALLYEPNQAAPPAVAVAAAPPPPAHPALSSSAAFSASAVAAAIAEAAADATALPAATAVAPTSPTSDNKTAAPSPIVVSVNLALPPTTSQSQSKTEDDAFDRWEALCAQLRPAPAPASAAAVLAPIRLAPTTQRFARPSKAGAPPPQLTARAKFLARGGGLHFSIWRREPRALLQQIASAPLCVLQGSTGCGKTSQLPQMLCMQWWVATKERAARLALASSAASPPGSGGVEQKASAGSAGSAGSAASAATDTARSFHEWNMQSSTPPVILITEFQDKHASLAAGAVRQQVRSPVTVVARSLNACSWLLRCLHSSLRRCSQTASRHMSSPVWRRIRFRRASPIGCPRKLSPQSSRSWCTATCSGCSTHLWLPAASSIKSHTWCWMRCISAHSSQMCCTQC